jgi:hypothetical protein
MHFLHKPDYVAERCKAFMVKCHLESTKPTFIMTWTIFELVLLLSLRSWLGGWCRDELFVEDCEEGHRFSFIEHVKWLWGLPSRE